MDVRQIPKATGSLPTGVVNASLTQLMASSGSNKSSNDAAPDSQPDFIPSKKYIGTKLGYVFTTRDRGTGYYKDSSKLDNPLPDSEDLLKLAEQAAKASEVTDERSLRKLVSNFDKRYKENLAKRTRHPDEPEKFMDSEVDLDEALRDLYQLANSPELYPSLVQTDLLQTLLHLLDHDNKDITAEAVQLLAALTDTTDNEEHVKPFQDLVSSLSDLKAVELMAGQLEDLDETSDEGAVAAFNILTVMDNMIDVQPAAASQIAQNKQLMRWLMMRLSRNEFDSVKQLCGEVMVELLQHEPELVLAAKGFEVVFRSIKQMASREVESEDELELIGNLFDALCCCLLVPEAKGEFVQGGGVEMMIEAMKARRDLRIGCLRVLEFATTKSAEACERVVRAFGLKPLFSVLMRKLKVASKPDAEIEQKSEELALTVISNLLEELNPGPHRDRVAAKFVENEFEKCDRLIEAYFIHRARVIAAEEEIQSREPSEDTEAVLSLRLDSGLAALQHVCLVVCHLWTTEDKALRKRLLLLLHQKGHTLQNVKEVVAEMSQMISADKDHFRRLLASLEPSESRSDKRATKEELKARIKRHKKSQS